MTFIDEVDRLTDAIENATDTGNKAQWAVELHAYLTKHQGVTDPDENLAWMKGLLTCLDAFGITNKADFLREQVRRAEGGT